MKSETMPIALPPELLEQFRSAAKSTGLSVADVFRQSAKLGLPLLQRRLCPPLDELILVYLKDGRRKFYVDRKLICTTQPGQAFQFPEGTHFRRIVFAKAGARDLVKNENRSE